MNCTQDPTGKLIKYVNLVNKLSSTVYELESCCIRESCKTSCFISIVFICSFYMNIDTMYFSPSSYNESLSLFGHLLFWRQCHGNHYHVCEVGRACALVDQVCSCSSSVYFSASYWLSIINMNSCIKEIITLCVKLAHVLEC